MCQTISFSFLQQPPKSENSKKIRANYAHAEQKTQQAQSAKLVTLRQITLIKVTKMEHYWRGYLKRIRSIIPRNFFRRLLA